jgi:chitosanase
MLTSLWENGTTVLQYAYCRNIQDGRGYTNGRAGFCTGTTDTAMVVRCFDAARGANNPLHKYLPALAALDAAARQTGENQGSTGGLDAVGNFCNDWKQANAGASAAQMKDCQDRVVDDLYYAPTVARAASWGLTQPLTIAALYDAEITHGADGVIAMMNDANKAVGNSAQTKPSAPLSLAQESAWLDRFQERRVAVLGGDSTWRGAIDRGAQYQVLRQRGNWDLSQPIVVDGKARALYPNKGYPDSNYPRCVIATDGSVSGPASCTAPISD